MFALSKITNRISKRVNVKAKKADRVDGSARMSGMTRREREAVWLETGIVKGSTRDKITPSTIL